MRILIIGGTRFVGRHLAGSALDRGHEVVLFNRGLTNPGLFPEARHVYGDRKAGELEKLIDEDFDAVFDTSAYHPADVMATKRLAGRVAQYVLVSTVSVYRDPLDPFADESAAVFTLSGAPPDDFSTPEEYGAFKALCEATAREIYRDRLLIVRPGLIIGPHDYTDRLTSWLRRLRTREEVLAGDSDQPLQLIDVRDLTSWMMTAVERGLSGLYNAVGPETPTTFKSFIDACSVVAGTAAHVAWTGDAFLIEHDVELPFWISRKEQALFQLANDRAREAGLRFRSLTRSLREIQSLDEGGTQPAAVGALSGQREDELLIEWHQRREARGDM